MKRTTSDHFDFNELVKIVSELRGEGGCPWDRVQTYDTIVKCLRDETDEVCEAVEKKDFPNLCEELGDVLLQIVFYASMAAEDGYFTMDDVINGICKKMVFRHPHVYGESKAESAEDALRLFKEAKSKEPGRE